MESRLCHAELLVRKSDVKFIANVKLQWKQTFQNDYVSHIYFPILEANWSFDIFLGNLWSSLYKSANLLYIIGYPCVH